MKVNKLTNNLQLIYNTPEPSDEEKQLSGSILQEEINSLQQQFYDKIRDNKHAKIRLESESAASKSWASSGKYKPPQDTIIRLCIPDTNPPQYVSKSNKMAEVARNYHENLQSQGLADKHIKDKATEEVLGNLDCRLSVSDKGELAKNLTRGEIDNVLCYLPNGKAPGIDGIPNELWKALHQQHKASKEQSEEKKPFDIAQILVDVYNDIEQYNITPGSNFSEGWMCPIYKKKSKSDIAN
jgi:hypothetical protein